MTRKFPCPYCKGKGGYRGSSDLGGKLEPDEPCGVCGDGWGMIEIGSPEHRKLKHVKLTTVLAGLCEGSAPFPDVDSKAAEILEWVAWEQRP